jgi:hypothetical protein
MVGRDLFLSRGRRRSIDQGIEEQKRLPTYKPDPVPAERAVIIYLAPALLQGSSCLPSGFARLSTGIGRAALKNRYMWHFSMQGLPTPSIA